MTDIYINNVVDGVVVQNGARNLEILKARIAAPDRGLVIEEGVDSGVNDVVGHGVTIESSTTAAVDLSCTSASGVSSVELLGSRLESNPIAIRVNGAPIRDVRVTGHASGNTTHVDDDPDLAVSWDMSGGQRDRGVSRKNTTTTTTDATPVDVVTVLSIPSGKSAWVDVFVQGCDETTPGQFLLQRQKVLAYNNGGTIGSVFSEKEPALDADARVGLTTADMLVWFSGSSVIVRVTGEASTTIKWVVTTDWIAVP